MSNKYCRCSCSAACRWISSIWFVADEEDEEAALEVVFDEVTGDGEVVETAAIAWAMARAW